MEFIDSHAHLLDPAFDADREELATRILPQAGIIRSVEIACAPQEWLPALQWWDEHPAQLAVVLGVHPEYARQFQPDMLKDFQQLLRNKQVVALGEVGLDYTCLQEAGREEQHALFCQMIACADRARLPLVLHVRRQEPDYAAYEDCFALLKDQWKQATDRPYAGVLHCFCARYEEAKKAVDEGLLLGINGCFTYKKNEYIREAVKKIGAAHIILETDCPYLAPQPKRGTRNDPSNIPLIAQQVADYLEIRVEELAQQTTLHTKLLYGLV